MMLSRSYLLGDFVWSDAVDFSSVARFKRTAKRVNFSKFVKYYNYFDCKCLSIDRLV